MVSKAKSATVSGAKYTIGIVGAGPVGSLLALGCMQLGYKVRLLDAAQLKGNNFVNPQTRMLVLNLASLQLFAQLGIKLDLLTDAQPITKVSLKLYRSLWSTNFDQRHRRSDFFGMAIAQTSLQQAINHVIEQVEKHSLVIDRIDYNQQGKIACGDSKQLFDNDLLILADGGFSSSLKLLGIESKSKQPTRHAIIGRVEFKQGVSLDETALEVFDPKHSVTCVLVPDATGCATLIVIAPLDYSAPDIAWINRRLNGFIQAQSYTYQKTYQLWESTACELIRPRTLVMGNAASSIYPLAAQGLNLAYLQAATLFDLLATKEDDPGSWHMLRNFAACAADQQVSTSRLVNTLKVIADSSLPLRAAFLGSHLPLVRSLLVTQANGGVK